VVKWLHRTRDARACLPRCEGGKQFRRTINAEEDTIRTKTFFDRMNRIDRMKSVFRNPVYPVHPVKTLLLCFDRSFDPRSSCGKNYIPCQSLRALSVRCGANRAISRRAFVTTAILGATCARAAGSNAGGSLRRAV
jgi:hypothetical protein